MVITLNLYISKNKTKINKIDKFVGIISTESCANYIRQLFLRQGSQHNRYIQSHVISPIKQTNSTIIWQAVREVTNTVRSN